jgi:hypothetical protein
LVVPHTLRFVGLSFLVPSVVSPSLSSAFAVSAAYGDLGQRPGRYHREDRCDARVGLLGAAFYVPTLIVPPLLVTHGLIFCCCCVQDDSTLTRPREILSAGTTIRIKIYRAERSALTVSGTSLKIALVALKVRIGLDLGSCTAPGGRGCFRRVPVLTARSSKVPSPNPQQPLSLDSENRSLCPLSLKRHSHREPSASSLGGQPSLADARSARKSTSSTKNSTGTERDQLS